METSVMRNLVYGGTVWQIILSPTSMSGKGKLALMEVRKRDVAKCPIANENVSHPLKKLV